MPIPGALDASSDQNARVTMVGVVSLVFPDLPLLRQRNVAYANRSNGLCCGPGVVPDGNRLVSFVGVIDRSRVAITKL